MGPASRSAVGTLVEQSSRYVMLLHLGNDKSAPAVERAMRRAMRRLPTDLTCSITWDRGAEMVRHVEFTTATNIPVYFCDPHSPWQRGTNENTNGLLRRYLPKGRDLTNISASELRAIERSLNSRPRKTLGYSTPLEKLTEFIALTA